MKIGDVVISNRQDYPLHCGSGYYTHAICASVDPFVLVSDIGDMVWYMLDVHNHTALCQAHPDIIKVVSDRVWINTISANIIE